MPNESKISEYEKIFSGWKIGKLIGQGSCGKTKVYEIFRKNFDLEENEILKVVNIGSENVAMDQMTDWDKKNFIAQRKGQNEKIIAEVRLMHELQNCSNIVSYQDYHFYEGHEGDWISLELLIRMHRYETLDSILKTRGISQDEVIRIGIDICTALEYCLKKEIVHRDIKPENIFYDNNQYLLGDFGISRILENGSYAQTMQGTKPYAAPEQFGFTSNLKGYDYSVDIYSLGLTLYVLANNGKIPFMDEEHSVEYAIRKRLTGNSIPSLKDIDPELNRIILKACAFKMEDRYASCSEMKNDLRKLQKNRKSSEAGKVKKIIPEDFQTEPQIGVIKSYATDQALKANDVSAYATEAAFQANTTSAYATEAAFQTNNTSMYATETVFRANNTNTYATEPALAGKGVAGYATEPALAGMERAGYATEPALAGIERVGYATEPALAEAEMFAKNVAEDKERRAVQDKELGVSIASIEVEEVKDSLSAEQAGIVNMGSESENVSGEEIRRNAVAEMVVGNNTKAFEYFATLAEKDDWEAMYNEVTKLFNSEEIIAQRTSDAIFWFDKCISNCKDSWTISLAEFQLGNIYAKGLGVKKNHKQAEKYYRSSASKGNPYAKKKFVAGKYVK